MSRHSLRAPENEPNRPRNTVRLNLEQLETRECPAVIIFNVNTVDDTPLVNSFQDPVTKAIVLEDKNKNVSLRSVVDYASNNILTGNFANNHYEVRLNGVAGKTISLTAGTTLDLKSNFNFLGSGVAVERPANPAVQFGLFQVNKDTVTRFFDMSLRRGATIGDGGAIRNLGEVTVEACTLMDNYAFDGGGAVSTLANTQLTIVNSTLGLNEASGLGGAVYADRAVSVTISSTSIIGNKASGPLATQGFGGGIYIAETQSFLIHMNTQITGNEATKDGGGIYVLKAALTMDGGQLFNNVAGGSGGGLYVDAPDFTVSLDKVSVTNNSAGQKGGGAYIKKGKLDGAITVLIGNSAAGGIHGIAYKKTDATAPITIPPNQQLKEEDQ